MGDGMVLLSQLVSHYCIASILL